MKRNAILVGVMSALWVSLGTVHAAIPEPKVFRTPEEAAIQLIESMGTNDPAQLKLIFGPGSEDVISSGDPVADRASRKMFVALAAETYDVETVESGNATLVLGYREWPFPIPLVKSAKGWSFDVKQGAEEILDRRVGKNEYNTIDSLNAFVQAQKDYFELKPNGIAEYAQRLGSTPGKKDGLFWPRSPKEAISPLGPLVVEAMAAGYKTREDALRAFHGYHYRILTRQGAAAPGGALDYLDAEKRLAKGFAFLAYPVDWGTSGVMSFIVNKDGTIYEKDLGSKTIAVAQAMTEYDPSKGWKAVKMDEEEPEMFQSKDDA